MAPKRLRPAEIFLRWGVSTFRAYSNGSTSNYYFYDSDGHVLLDTIGSLPWHGEMYAGGIHIATSRLNAQQNGGDLYFNFSDWLATERARTMQLGRFARQLPAWRLETAKRLPVIAPR